MNGTGLARDDHQIIHYIIACQRQRKMMCSSHITMICPYDRHAWLCRGQSKEHSAINHEDTNSGSSLGKMTFAAKHAPPLLPCIM